MKKPQLKCTPRENLLLNLLEKIINEYKSLLEFVHGTTLFKIIEIVRLSNIPGETQFIVQLTNKNVFLKLSAAEVINKKYDLKKFPIFHAEIIRQAAQGKLIEFLQLSEIKNPTYKIVSKKLNHDINQYIFTIKSTNQIQFNCTAEELSQNKEFLQNMDINDIYDIGYTNGNESVLKEKISLQIAKQR